MLNPQLHHAPKPSPKAVSPSALKNPFVSGIAVGDSSARPHGFDLLRGGAGYGPFGLRHATKSSRNPSVVRAIATAAEKTVTVRAVVTVKATVGGFVTNIGIGQIHDGIADLLDRSILLELVSAGLDPKTGKEKATIKGYADRVSRDNLDVKYEAEITIPASFGEVGAVLVENDHHLEIFLQDIVLHGLLNGPVQVSCNSWVHSKHDSTEKKVFFTNKSYLPSETPEGLKKLREKELTVLRGNGEGKRENFERVYDYATYNDIGDPDSSENLARPILGGKDHPYPRRCRTGRKPSKKDPLSESRSSSIYLPRDEHFSEVKNATFAAKTVRSLLHAVLPSLETAFTDSSLGFPYFTAVDLLFDEGVNVPDLKQPGLLRSILPRLTSLSDTGDAMLRFDTPELVDRDKFAWFTDGEFARQTLAGLNPYKIELVTEWPLKSKLDPGVYGSPESAITTDIIERQIRGYMTVDEAVKGKKLFLLDYHDAFLPFVNKVREQEGTTLYGSRTVFFLTPEGTLQPLAIELTRPPSSDGKKPQWKQAFAPSTDSTACWLWRFAKAHVLAHDSGYHQLVSHWLRTHCCTEPYIIATNRQLSAMHPVYRLLHPYFRYTMEINALARESLINAGGIIESSFSPGKYAVEISSAVYGAEWRFDKEALPADLIRRGLAVEDANSPHGVKLTIEDYPFASDGLDLWDAIKQWVSDYVNHYYPDGTLLTNDEELQAWWTEIRTKGHADKKDEPWWPVLNTPKDLIEILTTMIWVSSGHHAAVNFGQYHFGGYFPNRPTITRKNMPNEDPTDDAWKFFLKKPEAVLLDTFPSQMQATKVMAVLDVLSSHSPEEEYIGEKPEPSWAEDPIVNAAFETFTGKLKELEGAVDARNADTNLKNRHGAGIVPYELLKPFSKPGVTGMGVPNSISI